MKLQALDLSMIEPDEGSFGIGPYEIKGTNSVFKFNLNSLSTHLLFLGSTGTGKTNGILQFVNIIKNSIMGQDDVMVIFDTKGDYHSEFYCKERGDVIISNDINVENEEEIWNIFDEVTIDDAKCWDQNAYEITRVMYDEKISKAKDPFFPQAASDVTRGAVMALLRNSISINKSASNNDLVQILGRSDSTELNSLLQSYDDLRGISQYISLPSSSQTQGVMSEIRSITNDIFSGGFSKIGKFSVRNFIRQRGGRTLFIEYDLNWGRLLTPIYRLLIDLAIKESLGRSSHLRGNVFFVTDEFSLLPNLYHVDDGINFGRQQGTKFIVGTQNISQVLEAYGEGRGKSILSNFGILFAFRLNDQDSRNLVAGRYGKYRVRITLPSLVPSEPLSNHVVESDVLEPLALSLLPNGCCIICSSGIKPKLFQFALNKKRTGILGNIET
jgi:type IV secretory pathway TraG/TraD family ATPase VirD4